MLSYYMLIYQIISEVNMADAATPSRRLRKKNNTHQAILHSAKKLFEQRGLGNVTIDEISENADVSRSTFFTHFNSLDDLVEAIAAQEIDDLFAAAAKSDKTMTVRSLLNQLVDDTFPYPYLAGELLMRGIIGQHNTAYGKIDEFLQEAISSHSGYETVKKEFSSKELSALVMGAYFGLLFQKFMHNESFDSDIQIKDTINKYISFLKNY